MVALASLDTLVAGAISVGVLHTLAGPDHYVPLVAVGKQRRWSMRRLLGVTAACGLVHCLIGAALAAAAVALIGSLEALNAVQGIRSDLAAMLLVGLGVALMFAALRPQMGSQTRTRRRTPWVLGAVFVLGPCEWMVPALTGATAIHGLAGAALVALAFTAATITTMLVAVAAAQLAVARVATRRVQQRVRVHALAGACTALCGFAILAGL